MAEQTSSSPAGVAVAAAPGPSLPVLEPATDEFDDNDSAIGQPSIASETTSLASSIARYRSENGRTYHSHKEGTYMLPNDEVENDRLDLQHHVCSLTLQGKLYTSPIGEKRPVKRVLDAGTGTGIWAMDLADEFPEAEVIGIDLSPIQPSFVPPNVSFVIDDLEADWTYTKPFDFIYSRFLVGSIADWDKLIRQSFEHLAPGGWMETFEAVYPMTSDDGTVTEDQAAHRWGVLMKEAAAKVHPGRHLDMTLEFKDKMVKQGFTNVTEKWYKWPMNSWPKDPHYKELGAWVNENMLTGLQGFTLALFTRVLGWTREEVEMFLVEVRNDAKNRNIHGFVKVLVVSAQRPEVEETKET